MFSHLRPVSQFPFQKEHRNKRVALCVSGPCFSMDVRDEATALAFRHVVCSLRLSVDFFVLREYE